MKVTIDLDDDLADRVFEVAGNRAQRINDLVLELVREAVEPPAPLEAPEPRERPKQRWQQPVTPLIERVHEYSAEREWNPNEVEHFESRVADLWEQGNSDGEISVATGELRSRVARVRRRLGLPARQQVR